MGSGYSKRKKEAKAMEEQFLKMEAAMAQEEYTGQAGSGLVSITINGKGDVVAIKIKPECLDPEDPEIIEDLIKAAFKAAKTHLDSALSNLQGRFPF